MSTFIVETTDALPLDKAECEALFGYELVENRTRWINFVTVRNERWRDGNVVLLGDAAHTAHFSIGSGTKLAMEDAISLAWAVREGDIDAYEAERRPIVESTQRAAQGSLEWFEGIGRYTRQDPRTFAFNLLTRSRRITHGELRMRDPDFVAALDDGVPPMFEPFRLRALELANRVVVSPMDMYSSRRRHAGRLPPRPPRRAGDRRRRAGDDRDDLHERRRADHAGLRRALPRRARGGVEADRRLRARALARRDRRASSGHAGRKGSTQLLWEGEDQPLPDGNWPLIAPSPLPYLPGVSQVPREMTRADMDAVRDEFVAATRRADAAGFDLLEIHMAHGYLLSEFLSPLTNVRDDEYGADRAKFPLEVFAACRAVWPAEKPMSARISATDWVEGGFDGDDAVAFARRLVEAGCDIVDVSTGQVSPDQRPAYGRSLPDAVRRPDPPRGGHPGDRGRRDLQLRRRQHDHPRGPRRPLRARAPAPVGFRTGPCTPPPSKESTCTGSRSTGAARARRTPARTCAGCRCGASTRCRREDGRRHGRQARDRHGDHRAFARGDTSSRSPAPTST